MVSPRHPRATSPELHPPIAGMPAELWSWLRESIAVRPSVVARVKASLEAGERRSPDDIALAMLDRCPYRGKFAPYREVAPRA